jgi:hypothetical protein
VWLALGGVPSHGVERNDRNALFGALHMPLYHAGFIQQFDSDGTWPNFKHKYLETSLMV